MRCIKICCFVYLLQTNKMTMFRLFSANKQKQVHNTNKHQDAQDAFKDAVAVAIDAEC